jgi:hypothetical protein
MDMHNRGAWPPPAWDQPSAGHQPYATTLPGTARDDEPTSHDAQASAEGIVLDPDGDYLEFYGEKFRLADKVGLAPMIRFGAAANRGLDSDDMEGMAAMHSLIRSVIHRPPLLDDNGRQQVDVNGKKLRDEKEWGRFLDLAEDELADGEEIMDFVNRAMEIMAARPTKPRELSSGGSRTTSESSRVGSSSQAMHPEVAGLTPVADLGR